MRRQQLIDEKHAVQARIRSLRPRVEEARRTATTRREKHRVAKLERQLEGLMAREMDLRLAIDRTS